MSVLTLERVSKTFHQRTADAFVALDSVDFRMEEGDFVTIVGGNGAGKSTLLNVISGAIAVDSGNVYIDDVAVTHKAEEDRAALIGRVFQDPKMGTAPRMTVIENLLLAQKRGENRQLKISMNEAKRKEFIDLVQPLGLGLENRLDTEIGVLSGGQRQAITLLDEHTAALDPKTAKAVLELTRRTIADKGLSALMITHHLKDALELGNRMIVMNHGKIVRDFNAKEKAQLTAGELYEMVGELEEEID